MAPFHFSQMTRAWLLIILLVGQEAIAVRFRILGNQRVHESASGDRSSSNGSLQELVVSPVQEIDLSSAPREAIMLCAVLQYQNVKYTVKMRARSERASGGGVILEMRGRESSPVQTISILPDTAVTLNKDDQTITVSNDDSTTPTVLSYAGANWLQRALPLKNSIVKIHVEGQAVMAKVRESDPNGWFFVEYQPPGLQATRVAWVDMDSVELTRAVVDGRAPLLTRTAIDQDSFMTAVFKSIRLHQISGTCLEQGSCFVQCVKIDRGSCWPPQMCKLSPSQTCVAVEGDAQMARAWTQLYKDTSAAANGLGIRHWVIRAKTTIQHADNLASFVRYFYEEMSKPANLVPLQKQFPQLARALIASGGHGPSVVIGQQFESLKTMVNFFAKKRGCNLPSGALSEVYDPSFQRKSTAEKERYVEKLQACSRIAHDRDAMSESSIEKDIRLYKAELARLKVHPGAIEELAVQERINKYTNSTLSLLELGQGMDPWTMAGIAIGAGIVAIILAALFTYAGEIICKIVGSPLWFVERVYKRTVGSLFRRVPETQESVAATYRERIMGCRCFLNWLSLPLLIIGSGLIILGVIGLAVLTEGKIFEGMSGGGGGGCFDFWLFSGGYNDFYFLNFPSWNTPGISYDPSPPRYAEGRRGAVQQHAAADAEAAAYTFLMQWSTSHKSSGKPQCQPVCPNADDMITLSAFDGPVVRSEEILSLDDGAPRCYEIDALAEWLKLRKVDPASRKRVTLAAVKALIEKNEGEAGPEGGCVA
jgi:hypothetical protein